MLFYVFLVRSASSVLFFVLATFPLLAGSDTGVGRWCEGWIRRVLMLDSIPLAVWLRFYSIRVEEYKEITCRGSNRVLLDLETKA
ncbi:transmembrane protein, putative [Medicago truncatula]|uniref:Transmembrane protein, putative n=1 Tax=Medicago truncatula TaxID=3880 RepID=A0A072THY0_MEDTR|nr:transmembrane protein, putative [Medicago truncatula]